MRDRALALAVASRAGDSADAWMAALPEERRERVRAEMSEDVDEPDVRLAQIRADELKALEERASVQFGAAWREVNPSVRRSLWSRILNDGEGS